MKSGGFSRDPIRKVRGSIGCRVSSVPGGAGKRDRTDRQGECNGGASRAYRAARASASTRRERSGHGESGTQRRSFRPAGVRPTARLSRLDPRERCPDTKDETPAHGRKAGSGNRCHPCPAGRNRPGCRKRQLPMARASMSGQRPRGFSPRTARFKAWAWHGEGTRLRAAAVEAGSDAGLHLHLGICAWAFAFGRLYRLRTGGLFPPPSPPAGGRGARLASPQAALVAAGWAFHAPPRPWTDHGLASCPRTAPLGKSSVWMFT